MLQRIPTITYKSVRKYEALQRLLLSYDNSLAHERVTDGIQLIFTLTGISRESSKTKRNQRRASLVKLRSDSSSKWNRRPIVGEGISATNFYRIDPIGSVSENSL